MNPYAERIGDDLAPAGTWMATIVDIQDEFGVTRPKYENPQETEVVDLTCFLFGFRDQANQPHMLASRSMRISGNEKSTLFGFLKAILGRAPQYGWDYCELKGTRCLLTVEHAPRRDGGGVFPSVAALSPVPTGFGGQAAGVAPQAAGTPATMPARSGQGAVGSRQGAGVPYPVGPAAAQAPVQAPVMGPAVQVPAFPFPATQADDPLPF
jgi:hypothetical protein